MEQHTTHSPDFWQALDTLIATSELVLDRPRGTAHPRYPKFRYPYDYGYLAGTRSGDGDGIDVWIGSLPERSVAGVIYTVDLLKRDAEMKLLLGCTQEDAEAIVALHAREPIGHAGVQAVLSYRCLARQGSGMPEPCAIPLAPTRYGALANEAGPVEDPEPGAIWLAARNLSRGTSTG